MGATVIPLGVRTDHLGPTEPETVTVPCARPACRENFERPLVRGRRQDYCCKRCRELVNAERRRSRARLRHSEESAAKLRADCAAYDAGRAPSPLHVAEEQLKLALARSQGVLAYAPADDKAVEQLAALVAAASAYLQSAHG